MKKITLKGWIIGLFFGSASMASAQTYTFTSAGATGSVGPDQTMVNLAYTGTSLDGLVEVTSGIQYWIVPTSGNYQIEAYGGQGYGPFGGRGAQIGGEFYLTAGDTLKILVGQMAGDYYQYPGTSYNHQFGGGGGSFVTMMDNTPYVVAGGGGGNHGVAYVTTCDGQLTTNGAAGANGATISIGGTAGSGGLNASSADGGGGLLGNGAGTAAGFAFVNGGAGGALYGFGGFGGGGGTSSWNNYRGGGGGGYSGGGAGNNGASCCPCGGGGGSYNAGTNQNNVAGVQTGNGMVVVTNLCSPSMLTPDIASLADLTGECSVDLVTAPTATNDCNVTVIGTPDVTFPITTSGLTVVTWTYSDGLNTNTQIQNVIIADATAPVPDAASLADTMGWCAINALPIPTATDNCGGVVLVTSDANLPITAVGTTVVTWTFTDSTGNTSTQMQNVIIDGPDNGVTQNGATLTADESGASYQWIDCATNDAIAGATSQSFTPTAVTGNYAVEVTLNGCTVTSACFLVDYTGIDQLEQALLVLYPNPSADGQFVIDAEGVLEAVEVFDVAGRKMEVKTDLSNGKIDGSRLSAGKYLVRISVAGQTFNRLLIISK
jgi:hypothetical protein